MDCIAIQSLGHDTALGRGAGRAGRAAGRAGRAGRRWGAQLGAQGAAAGGASERVGRAGVRVSGRKARQRADARRRALRQGRSACDMAGWHPRYDASEATIRPSASGHARAWARQCAPGRASWASWVLVHPAWFFDLVFDLVMFLSHRLNPVHEHCS